jgi:hypothetical protein
MIPIPRKREKPRVCVAFLRVSDGDRTRDRRNHNPELYQLSYAHHERPGV